MTNKMFAVVDVDCDGDIIMAIFQDMDAAISAGEKYADKLRYVVVCTFTVGVEIDWYKTICNDTVASWRAGTRQN